MICMNLFVFIEVEVRCFRIYVNVIMIYSFYELVRINILIQIESLNKMKVIVIF